MCRLPSISQQQARPILSNLSTLRDNWESLISFPHSLHVLIPKPDAVFPACHAVHHPPQEAVAVDWLKRMFLCSIISISWVMMRSDQQEKLYTSELFPCLCVSCEVARSSLDAEEDVRFYDVWYRLCSSVLVLAEDSWSAAASRLHLLCSITPADFLGPERNLTDSGEQHCQVHFNPSLHTDPSLHWLL